MKELFTACMCRPLRGSASIPRTTAGNNKQCCCCCYTRRALKDVISPQSLPQAAKLRRYPLPEEACLLIVAKIKLPQICLLPKR